MLDIALEELFVAFGSEVVEVTVAVFVEVEAALNVVALTLIVITAVLPTLRLPSVQVTVPAACAQEPWLVKEDAYVTSPGNGSVTVTPCATAGPPLVTCSV